MSGDRNACHGPGDAVRDFSIFGTVRAQAARIRGGVDSGQFPVGNGPKPTRAERDASIAWIDGGLAE